MTTPVLQGAPAVSPLEEWFDAELRPALLERLAAANGQAAASAEQRRLATIASVNHWLGELGRRFPSWSEETQQVVAVLADELRGRIGG
jgi:hypothetical protein